MLKFKIVFLFVFMILGILKTNAQGIHEPIDTLEWIPLQEPQLKISSINLTGDLKNW